MFKECFDLIIANCHDTMDYNYNYRIRRGDKEIKDERIELLLSYGYNLTYDDVKNALKKCIIIKNIEKYNIKFDSQYLRPTEVDALIGDPSKAKASLKWEPKTQLEELCSMMVKADITRNKIGVSF